MAVKFVRSRYVLAVQNLRISTDFYMNVLGFSRDFGDESDGWSFLSRDTIRLMLGECSDDVAAGELRNHSYFAHIIVEGIDELYEDVKGKGAEILAAPQNKPWGLREFCLRTPDGHRIVFGQER